jgi:hypothetical protein
MAACWGAEPCRQGETVIVFGAGPPVASTDLRAASARRATDRAVSGT